jgi:hypothetical protein
MTNEQFIDALIEQAGGIRKLAAEMSVSRQSLWHWRNGKMSLLGRFLLSKYARRKRIALPEDFMERG